MLGSITVVVVVVGGFLSLMLASVCGVSYELIGVHVDADGRLHEAFLLIPLAWLFALAGVCMVAVGMWRRRR